VSKINIRVGDKIQWYRSTALHTITSIDGDMAYYDYTDNSGDYLDTIERKIKSGNMFKYIPVKQKQKVQPKLKTEKEKPVSKINIRVGDQIQWCQSTNIHVITKIENGKVYYHDTPCTDNVKTILDSINCSWMFKYIPVKQKQKVQPKLKTENRVVRVNAVRDILKKSNGQIFTVAFRKRTNGEIRIMNARLGVQKRLTGKGMSYNPKNRGLMTVFDMQKQEYRMIDIRTVIWLKVNGTMYTVS